MTSIRISTPDQTLELCEHGEAIRRYLVSTAKIGAGGEWRAWVRVGNLEPPRRNVLRIDSCFLWLVA